MSLADALPRELLDMTGFALARPSFLAANPPPWDDITEACYHGQLFHKLDEHLDDITCATHRVPTTAPRVIHANRLDHFDGQRYDLRPLELCHPVLRCNQTSASALSPPRSQITASRKSSALRSGRRLLM